MSGPSTGNLPRNGNVCSTCSKQEQAAVLDYYWRDYVGIIPPDAVPGGRDVSNKTTYIGQAHYYKAGLLIGSVYPGKPDINMACYGYVKSAKVGVKILCSRNLNYFTWTQTDRKSLHSAMIGKQLVFGGCKDDKIINIGRVAYQGEIIVGSVLGYEAENAQLCFAHEDKEIVVNSYEVLTYNKA